ncbi:hypothetical protein CR513_28910, partial [Mucuna pruriens]
MPGAHPINQKKRRLGEEKKRAVKAETARLLQARFIREVKYPNWLSNMVMIRKPSGKWRMCTDYTDLNKACLKDPYPLPSIDALMNEALGCGLLSFIEEYSSYNQIRMHPYDESKTAFMTDEEATYQRLMNRIFKEHIGNKLELKLNPEKCSFGVKADKFLGFMLTRRGIEANPEKCSIIINMRSPRSVKEKSTPIFQRLRKAKHFKWANDYEAAFQELKAMLAAPPILTRPVVAYERRGHMKAQVLVDFINELTPNFDYEEASKENRWTLSVDNSSNKNSNRS